MSPALILSARILSIRYLPVLDFGGQAHFKRGSCLCLSMLPLSPSSRPRGPSNALAVGSMWLCCRCPVLVEDITPVPWFPPPAPPSHLTWGDASGCPHAPFLPRLPLPHPTAKLCVAALLCHTEMRYLVCEPGGVSFTSACLEQRGCVRVRVCGAFLVGSTPLYLEGRNMRRLEGSGGKKPTDHPWEAGMASPIPCGKWGCRE